MKLRLQVRQSPEKAFSWEHTGPAFRIGRDPSCELALQGDGSQSVSWNHARVELTSAGAFITDLGSSNGTYVNGRHIEGRTRFEFGDLITLGRTGPRLQVGELELDGAGQKAPPATAFERLPELPAPQLLRAAAAPGRRVPAVMAPESPASESSGHTTRLMLLKLQTSQRRSLLLIGGLLGIGAVVVIVLMLVFGVSALIFWRDKPSTVKDEQPKEKDGPLSGAKIYDDTLRSTVWVLVPLGGDEARAGSGSLIDRDRKLIVTNQHVVGEEDIAVVFFPSFDETGKAIGDKVYYGRPENVEKLGIVGKVVKRDISRDLAFIELRSLPSNIPVLRIAEEGVRPGQTVHSIGNPGGKDTPMWVYTSGTVRQVHEKTWNYNDGFGGRKAWAVETQSSTNPGDSGGPVVNDRGELVAVVAGARSNQNLMTFFIDRREVAAMLRER